MFLANENFPRPSVLLLRQSGFSVQSIQEEMPGVSDQLVFATAIERNLVILTFDRDYGELIFRYAATNPPSVLYFRDKGANPLFAGELLLKLMSEGLKFEGAFSVIEEKSLRQRFYK
jgi:predicted nuclease of predicted toxin-antitoxin system